LIHIRKFLAREGKFLLEEFGAPDARTVLWRALFWVYFVTGTGFMLGGLYAVYLAFGFAAMYACIFILFLVYVRLQRRVPVYFDDDPIMLGGDPPRSLPPPGRQALPPLGTPQIGRVSTASAPSRPGPVARR
jgi:hypothetical protein